MAGRLNTKKNKPAASSAADPKLIDGLAWYRLLTIRQAAWLCGSSEELMGERFRVLNRQGLVGLLNQPRMLGPRVHWLTPKGVALAIDYAAERGETIQLTAPKNGFSAGEHLRQRIGIVDCHLGLRAWAGASGAAVEGFRVEFEANPQGLLAKALSYPWALPDGTAQPPYQPDAVGILRLADGSRFLFAVEVETGGVIRSLDNFRKKLPARLGAFERAALEVGSAWPKSERRARLLFVFSDDRMLEGARAILARQQSHALPYVYLNTLDVIRSSFGTRWVQGSGVQANPFKGS